MVTKKTTAKEMGEKLKAKAEEMAAGDGTPSVVDGEVVVDTQKAASTTCESTVNEIPMMSMSEMMEAAASMQKPVVEPTTVTVSIEGTEVELNLMRQCPSDLLATAQYIKVPYMPIKLIRKIGRELGWRIVTNEEKVIATAEGIILSIRVNVLTATGSYEGSAMDYIAGKSVAKSLDGQSSRIKALAIKDALKWKYPFFDINFDEADDTQQNLKKEGAFVPAPVEAPATTPTKPFEPHPLITEMEGILDLQSLKNFAVANRDAIKEDPRKQEIVDKYNELVKKLGA